MLGSPLRATRLWQKLYGKRSFSADSSIALPFLQFLGNVDEVHANHKRKKLRGDRTRPGTLAAVWHGSDEYFFSFYFLILTS